KKRCSTTKQSPFAAASHSWENPLTDSNLRPPPYHGKTEPAIRTVSARANPARRRICCCDAFSAMTRRRPDSGRRWGMDDPRHCGGGACWAVNPRGGAKGEGMRRRVSAVLVVGPALVAAGFALAAQPPAKTFVAVLNPEEEVPACTAASNGAGGTFVAHVVDEATGTVAWKLVAHNLPAPIVAPHIHA